MISTEVESSTLNVLKRLSSLSEINRSISNKSGPSVQSKLKFAFSLKFNDEIQQTIYETILSYAIKAEQFGPGGFDSCINNLIMCFGSNDTRAAICGLKMTLENTLKQGTLPAMRDDINRLLTFYVNGDTRMILEEALELSGLTGRIVIEKSASEATSVELVRGYTFGVSPAFDISGAMLISEPKIAVVDGFIENVSEINSLLMQAHEAKSPVLLFIRGLSDEVKHTLKVNYDRGSLVVIPLVVRFDFEGINSLVDIAIVSGGDVFSTAKGELFTSIMLQNLSSIKSATLYRDKIVLVNSRSRDAVKRQVNLIREKRASEQVESIAQLYDLRIKSLSPNQVMIRLPDDDAYVVTSQAIDYALRGVKSLVERGVSHDRTPATSMISGIVYAIRCAEILENLGAVVTL